MIIIYHMLVLEIILFEDLIISWDAYYFNNVYKERILVTIKWQKKI